MADEDEIVIVCMRLADMPGPPVLASVVNCNTCGARCWLADSSPHNLPILCKVCFDKREPDETDGFIFTKRQIEDVQNYFKQRRGKHDAP